MQKIGDIPNTRADINGEFTDGSVAGGVPPTILPAEFFNTVQRELVNIVESSDLELNPTDDSQVLAALDKRFLQSTNNLSEIKSAGPDAVSEALKNLGLENMKYVTARGGNVNGAWTRWSDGTIEMYGTSGVQLNGLATVVFPITLPGISYHLSIAERIATDVTSNVAHVTMIIDSTLTESGFKARSQYYNGAASTFAFSWRIIYAVV